MSEEQDIKVEIRDQRKQGWYWIDSRLVRRDGKALGASAIAVYNVLASYANNETQQSFPGIRKIAALLGMSATTVRECIKRLKDAGWIDVMERISDDGKRHLSNIYIMVPAPATATVAVPSLRQGATARVTDLDLSRQNSNGNGNHKPSNPFFDAVVQTCQLDADKLSGGAVTKVVKRLKDAGWTPQDIIDYGKTRSGKPPLLHTLDTDMAVKGWRAEDKPSNVNPEMKIYR